MISVVMAPNCQRTRTWPRNGASGTTSAGLWSVTGRLKWKEIRVHHKEDSGNTSTPHAGLEGALAAEDKGIIKGSTNGN